MLERLTLLHQELESVDAVDVEGPKLILVLQESVLSFPVLAVAFETQEIVYPLQLVVLCLADSAVDFVHVNRVQSIQQCRVVLARRCFRFYIHLLALVISNLLALFFVFLELMPLLQEGVQLIIDCQPLNFSLSFRKHLSYDVLVLKDAQGADGLGDSGVREEMLQPFLLFAYQFVDLGLVLFIGVFLIQVLQILSISIDMMGSNGNLFHQLI